MLKQNKSLIVSQFQEKFVKNTKKQKKISKSKTSKKNKIKICSYTKIL